MPFVYFVILVGVLVFVHELGHFVWAKFFGVKILKFSLGLGPRVLGFRLGETEYVLAALPLGGYVRMLGDNPLDEVRAEEAHRALQNQSVFKRIVIVVAGPLMNLAFPIVLYFVVFLGDISVTPATIGTVLPGWPAEGKLLEGDQVVAIDGDKILSFYELVKTVDRHAGRPLRFSVQRGDRRIDQTIVPVRSRLELPLDRSKEIGRIGVSPQHPIAVVGVTSPSSPAALAGLETFDLVIAAGGVPVRRWIDLDKLLARNQGTLVPITYLRPATLHDALGGLVELDLYEPRVTVLTPDPGSGSGATRAGIELADLYVSQVTANSPEHRLGLLPGDRLLTLDGRPIRLWTSFTADLEKQRGIAHTLTWRRAEQELSGRLSLEHQRGVTDEGQVYDRYAVAARNWVPTVLDPPISNPHLITYAIGEAFRATAEVVELTAISVVRLFQGRLTVKSIGGPLTMFEAAGTAARAGALNYLTLMAFISVNLGLINLAPIPLLDGGHLMFFVAEAALRRRISLRVREYAYFVGLALLVMIMVLAFSNDIERQWPQIISLFAGQ
jgi:regulator of sigma E protease